MSKRIVSNLTRLLGAALVAVAAACGGAERDADATGSSGSGGRGGQTGSVPSALVGSWYAGSGYTSAPYDPNTGSWGTPNGSGLVYVFHANGTYTRAFQSYHSNYGCTTGFTAFLEGVAIEEGGYLRLTPSSGHIKYTDTCAPSLNSDKPDTELAPETLAWAIGQDEYDPNATVLQLANELGASSVFHLLQ